MTPKHKKLTAQDGLPSVPALELLLHMQPQSSQQMTLLAQYLLQACDDIFSRVNEPKDDSIDWTWLREAEPQ